MRAAPPGADVVEVGVEKRLDAGIGGAQAVAEQLVFLMIVAQQGTGEIEEMRIGSAAAGGLAERCQLEIDVAYQFLVSLRRHANDSGGKFHRGTERGRLRLTF